MHNNDTNEDFIVENFKMNGDEIINENGDIYKILSHEQRRSKIRYTVQLKMKKTIGGCNCQDPMIHQAYRNFLDSLDPEDQQGFRELLTGQPDIDTDLIDSNHTNPEIRQKFKKSGIANLKLQLTPKQRTQLIFGKTKRGKNYNLVSDAQLKVSEKYFNMRPDDLQSLRNQSLLTQIKQQVDENDVTQPSNIQQPYENENNDEVEEINMDDDIEQPTTPNTNNVVDLIGQARKKKASKQKRYNKLYYQNITLDENDNDFLNTGVHNFKFRTFRMNQTLSEDDQQQLELFDELKHSIISSPLTEEQIQGKGRRRKFFNQPMNEEPNQDYNEDVLNNANNGINIVEEPQQENVIQNTDAQNANANTQNPNAPNPNAQNTNTANVDAANDEQKEQDTQSEQEQSGDISVIESSTSGDEETSEGTSEGTSSEDSIIPLQENQEHEKLYRRLLNEEDEFELI